LNDDSQVSLQHEGGPARPAALTLTMPYRRAIAFLLTLLLALAVCVPRRPDEGQGPIRQGKHLSRVVEQALVLRNSRGARKNHSGQRRGGLKAWSAGLHDSLAPDTLAVRTLPVRTVDTLPGHWGALHLTI
jgi:hypothetical protein